MKDSKGELNKDSVTEEFSVVQKEAKLSVRRKVTFYNLDAIISVGYTDPKKFYEYSLNETNINGVDKAVHYKSSLGFDKSNGEILINQIDAYVKADSSVPEKIVETVHGIRYRYKIPVKGINGECRNVIAVYQIDKGNVIPRLITNFLE